MLVHHAVRHAGIDRWRAGQLGDRPHDLRTLMELVRPKIFSMLLVPIDSSLYTGRAASDR
jgi:hypothetical protein